MSNINELTAKCHQIIEDAKARHKDVQIYAPVLRWSEFMMLIEALEAAEKRIADLTAERDALREGEMGDAKHSNTRAAADIYFQLVEECDIPPGGSLVEFVDDMKERIASLEARTLIVKLPDPLMPAQHNSGELFMSPDDVEQGGYLNRDDVVRVLRKAGIKLQIEGE